MIYHTNRHNELILSRQQGISLMLSILLLAAITAISFSFITIVFIELRSSTDFVRSEPALYATLGVTEEALFQYKRYVNERDIGITLDPPLLDVTDCSPNDQPPTYFNICKVGNVSVELPSTPFTQPLAEDDPVRLETVYAKHKNVIPLYQVNDFSLQYSKLILQRVPVNNNDKMLVQVRAIAQDPNIEDSIVVDEKLFESTPTLTINQFFENYQYELILDNPSDDNIQVSIASFGPGVNPQPKGLPFVGKKVLKVMANYLGLTRMYKVYIPVP